MDYAKVAILRQSLHQASIMTEAHMLFVPLPCFSHEQWDKLQALSEERFEHFIALAGHRDEGLPHPGDFERMRFERYGKTKGWRNFNRSGVHPDRYKNSHIQGAWEAWQEACTQ